MKEINKNLSLSIKDFATLTCKSPIAIHLNPSGLIKFDKNNKNRFEVFRKFILSVENLGGNV